MEWGFNDVAHFSRSFSSAFGISRVNSVGHAMRRLDWFNRRVLLMIHSLSNPVRFPFKTFFIFRQASILHRG
jgi:hypothetical protein